MTTFPSIAPVYPASKGSAAELSGVQLGDGYKARYSFGLNNTKPEWRLEWLVDQISSDAIDLFLQSCADNAEFFQWKPPDSSSELNWRCDEWTVEQQSYNLYSVKATFKRAFEVSMLTLSSAPAICQEEYCGFDYGNWEIIIPEIGDPPFSPYINSTVTAPPVLPCYGATLQWYRNGVPIVGATGSTYTLTSADAGQAITLGYDCPGDLPGGSGISAPIYPISYPWEKWDGSPIYFGSPGLFSFAIDVYANFDIYQCGTNNIQAGEHISLYRTYTFSHPAVISFRLNGEAVRNQSGICYPANQPGGYGAGTPIVELYNPGNALVVDWIFWNGDAGISWGPPVIMQFEPRGVASHVVVNATFNGQPVYAPLPAN